MTSRDVYIVALGGLQLFFLLHGMYIINAGAGLTLVAESGFFGYLSMGFFTLLFGLVFANMASLAGAISETGLGAISRTAKLSVAALVALVSLQLLNALSLYGQYQQY
jgi:hypothetical protein